MACELNYPLVGAVMYEGKPLEGATVTLHPKRGSGNVLGRRPSAKTDAKGRFEIKFPTVDRMEKGAPAGAYNVTIVKVEDDFADANLDPDAAQAAMIKKLQQAMKKRGAGDENADLLAPKFLTPREFAQPPFTPVKVVIAAPQSVVIEMKKDATAKVTVAK